MVSPVLVIYKETSPFGTRIVCPSYIYSSFSSPFTWASKSTLILFDFAISYRESPFFTL